MIGKVSEVSENISRFPELCSYCKHFCVLLAQFIEVFNLKPGGPREVGAAPISSDTVPVPSVVPAGHPAQSRRATQPSPSPSLSLCAPLPSLVGGSSLALPPRFDVSSLAMLNFAPRRLLSSAASKRIFGICAHVDAGKTTLSERMLYYAGSLARMGDVDAGSTTMDFLPAERERGITINSAAVSFDWRHHAMTLVDSPGHLDFTYEVQRALRVMDGVVVVVDAVAGVQAQTETVWRQADGYGLARVVFVNKMDRRGADFGEAVASLEKRLGARVAVLHRPDVDEGSGEWRGFLDLVTMETVRRGGKDEEGVRPTREELRSGIEELGAEILLAREALIEALADFDEVVMEKWVAGETISTDVMKAAIRRATIRGDITPVLCGSSLKNCGVQAVMNAVTDYLPSPVERGSIEVGKERGVKEDGALLALAFKVVFDTHRGKMVYLRAFCGSLEAGVTTPLFNVSKGKKEMPTALLKVMADRTQAAEGIETGDIFAAIGLKHTVTGDTLCVRSAGGKKKKSSQEVAPLEGVPSPPAVVSVAVEAESTSQQRQLDEALDQLLAEDPSLKLSTDANSGETLLSGMGQLHLDVVIDRLSKSLPNPIHVSKPRVAYRESITSSVEHEERYDGAIGSVRQSATISLSLCPISGSGEAVENEVVLPPDLAVEYPVTARSLERDVLTALGRGSLLGSPTTGIRATVLSPAAVLAQASSDAALSACVSSAVAKAISSAGPVLLEPVMQVQSTVPESAMGAVIGDLTHPTLRRGLVDNVDRKGSVHGDPDSKVLIYAKVPLAGMVDWATRLRSITKGLGDFSMEFHSYQAVGQATEKQLLNLSGS